MVGSVIISSSLLALVSFAQEGRLCSWSAERGSPLDPTTCGPGLRCSAAGTGIGKCVKESEGPFLWRALRNQPTDQPERPVVSVVLPRPALGLELEEPCPSPADAPGLPSAGIVAGDEIPRSPCQESYDSCVGTIAGLYRRECMMGITRKKDGWYRYFLRSMFCNGWQRVRLSNPPPASCNLSEVCRSINVPEDQPRWTPDPAQALNQPSLTTWCACIQFNRLGIKDPPPACTLAEIELIFRQVNAKQCSRIRPNK